MDTALRIFAEKSFQEATISEISKKAGVSEATIYEYFGTKEDLLFAIPEKISNDANEDSEAVLPYIKDAEGRMRAILFSYIQLYESNPHYSALVLLQLMSSKRFRQTAAHAAIRRSAHRLLECIREGIADGTFRSDADAYLIRSMLMGTIEHLFIHWHMQGMPKRDKTIMEMLDPFLEIVLSGIRARKEQQGLTLRLNLEDARVLEQILQNDPMLQSPARSADAARTTKEKTKQHL
ncbi:MAG: helix-turn-helix transcriptional regulator [Smithella sp.]|nr:helix-turn-helix transcriptional regulator [Smithella sp.]